MFQCLSHGLYGHGQSMQRILWKQRESYDEAGRLEGYCAFTRGDSRVVREYC